MAREYEVLSGLNRILESQERREQFRVQQALAMMQFGVAKKQFAIQQEQFQIQKAQTSLDVLGKMNIEYTSFTADAFMNYTGFGATVRTPEEGEPVQDSLTAMSKDIASNRYGDFSKSDAQDISAAVYNYQQLKDPSGIIRLLTRLGGESNLERLGGAKSEFLKKFADLGVGPQLLQLADAARKSTKNEEDILREQAEFGRGDYKIDREIGIHKPLKDALNQMRVFSDPVLGPLLKEVEDAQFIIANASALEEELTSKSELGIITDEEKEELIRIPLIIEEETLKVSDITTRINTFKAKKEKAEAPDYEIDVGSGKFLKSEKWVKDATPQGGGWQAGDEWYIPGEWLKEESGFYFGDKPPGRWASKEEFTKYRAANPQS